MLKKEITYKRYFGDDGDKPVIEDFYFNLTEFEVVEINLMEDLIAVGKSSNPRRIIPTFKRIIKAAVGQKIGDRFVKTEEFTEEFLASEAYSNLFIEILGSGDSEAKMAAFIKGIIPSDLSSVQEFDTPAAEVTAS